MPQMFNHGFQFLLTEPETAEIKAKLYVKGNLTKPYAQGRLRLSTALSPDFKGTLDLSVIKHKKESIFVSLHRRILKANTKM